MEAFRYRNGQLHCEGVALALLAREFETPLYVYSAGHIRGQYQQYDAAFRAVDHLVCCAVKANGNLGVLRLLARAGSGFDIVSGGELYRVLQAGGDPHRCVFAGVGKTREEIEYALKQGVYSFNVESEPELRLLAAVAAQLGQRAPIALRVNPGVDPHTHHYVSTGKHESKFGIPLERALAVYRAARALPSLTIRGVQMHIGSQITSVTPFVQAVKKMLPLVQAVQRLAPDTMGFFDIGGGLGIRYHQEQVPTPARLAAAVLPYLRPLRLQILLEPGRSTFGNGGVLLARVLFVKQTHVKRFVIVNAAMNDLIRPSLYGSYHEIQPVRRRRGKLRVVDVVGPVCESGDFLATGRKLPEVAADDLLAVMSAGAYGMTMASNYNARPRPAEVLVSGRQYALVRRRETMKDLVGGELTGRVLR